MELQTFGSRKDKHSYMDALALEGSFYMPLPGRPPINYADFFSKVRNYKVVGCIDFYLHFPFAYHEVCFWLSCGDASTSIYVICIHSLVRVHTRMQVNTCGCHVLVEAQGKLWVSFFLLLGTLVWFGLVF